MINLIQYKLKVWWNEDCKRAVALSRKARNACDPKRGGINCETNRPIWREKESQKKKIILKAKQTTLNKHKNSQNPKSSHPKHGHLQEPGQEALQRRIYNPHS